MIASEEAAIYLLCHCASNEKRGEFSSSEALQRSIL